MEDRQDLERLLLDGLPELEREHVVAIILNTTAAKLRYLRASGSDYTAEPEPDEAPTA